MRKCGECTLCCKLVPTQERPPEKVANTVSLLIEKGIARPDDFRGMIPDFNKEAGKRCPHQRHGGCTIYSQRPLACRLWSCRWLTNDDTADLRRPDRSRYVIDIMPDYVRARENTGEQREFRTQAVQVWVDGSCRSAWRDPELLAYLERRGQEGIIAIIRVAGTEEEDFVLVPPNMSDNKQWLRIKGQTAEMFSTWPDEFQVELRS